MDLLSAWLADVGIHSHNLEQDFSSGFLFGKLLDAYALQPDLSAFVNKGKPDAYLNNYTRLQPTLSKLGVQLDTRTAQALINKEPGLAAKILLAIKQQLEQLLTNLQSADAASKTLQQCTVRTSPSRGLLEAQKHKSQYAALDSSNSKFFEDVMRKHSSSPNRLMESLHLRQFADESSRQAAAAADARAAAAASQAAARATFRDGLKAKMAATRMDKATKLQRDEAVHAAILRHQDDVEREELRVETALAELGCHRHQDQRRAAAADAAAGIDAFEMTLKRLGTAGSTIGNAAEPSGPAAAESPMTTLGRIRSFAPTAAKLADSKGEYLSAIKSRRQEEAAARKEREGRRRRMLVEQQAARSAAEGRVEADCLLEVLVRRSGEEQKLAEHLWQLQQEKAAMEAGRRLREEQYAALKDKEWEDTLRREAEKHRALQSDHAATVLQELTALRQQQKAEELAADADKIGFAHDTAWQLVQLAERVVEFRAATGGQAVPLADWRSWLSLFLAGDASLGTPIIISSDPAALQETPSAQAAINTIELKDYMCCKGAWALDAAAATPGGCNNGSRPTTPGALAQEPIQANKALGEVVAELARLAQRLRPGMRVGHHPHVVPQPPTASAAQPQLTQGTTSGSPDMSCSEVADVQQVVSAAEAASGSGAAPGADIIHGIPLKLAVAGSPFSGKSSVAHTLAQAFGLKLLSPEQLLAGAIAAATAWQEQQQQQQQQQQQHPSAAGAGGAAPESAEPPRCDAATATAAASAAPPQLVTLGLQAAEQLQAGAAVSDELLLELLFLGMQQAQAYVPVPPEPAQPETPVKGSKGPAGKGAAAAAGKSSESGTASGPGARHGSSCGGAGGGAANSPLLGAAAALAAGLGGSSGPAGPALPANLAPGTPGRGFVIDGFPATAAQAALLEKALTGLDLAAEQQLVQGASLIAPPPACKLPQLHRPLLSGLDAVIMLDCADETLALQRVLGRRQDPVTGQDYHLDFDPPPANNPGLCERLVQAPLAGQDEEAGKVAERLASWASSSRALTAWLARFSTLRRPLDAAMPLSELLMAAGDMMAGVLTAKAAAQAAQAAAEAAKHAQTSAEKAQELSRASQLHAEAAARDLLASKKAELQVLQVLLTTGKNPDPAAAELVKAQAAVKCADQLKTCHAAAADAAAHAEHARAAADAAASAVVSCKKSVGDAAVSAEALVLANKAAADAEAAATAAGEAAQKAQSAKTLSDGYAQDAEKWAAAADVPLDAAISSGGGQTGPPAAPVAALAATASSQSLRPASGRNSGTAQAVGKPGTGPSTLQPSSGAGAATTAAASTATAASANLSTASSNGLSSDVRLGPAGCLPAPLLVVLHEEWSRLEHAYVEGMGHGFTGLREAHFLAVNQVAANRSWFKTLLQQPDHRQVLLQDFVSRFNAVELDMRRADETKGELLLRCEELRDALWGLCDAKHEAAEAARLKLAGDGSAAEQVALMGTQLSSLVQVELDRFVATAQFLWSYCHSSHGVHHPTPADKVFAHVNVLAGHDAAAAAANSTGTSKAEQGSRASMMAAAGAAGGAHLAILQQRLPQLASALKAAQAAGTAVESGALTLATDAHQRAVAAAAHAAATASTAAAAAAAAAGLQSASGAAAHRQPATASGAKGAAGGPAAGSAAGGAGAQNTKVSAAAAAASSKLAASCEDAAAAAAAAAAVVAAMPDQAVLAAVLTELREALGVELALLQQRLAVLGRRAGALVEEVVQLHAACNSELAEWSHRRYVTECGAVAALERVIKAAAAAGKPLAHDLRLEDDVLVVDSTQQLVAPPVSPPAPRPATPPLPPGVLSVKQLSATAAAMQAAQHPAGFLAMQAAVDIMMGLASQGVLPSAWRDVDASHMASALAAFDPTYSGYLDWRELLLALAAASLPALHTATPAQMATQALQLAAADGDGDGALSRQEFEGLHWWWFEPGCEELVRQGQADGAAAPSQQHGDVLQELSRGREFSQLLWDVFKQPATSLAAAASAIKPTQLAGPDSIPSSSAAALLAAPAAVAASGCSTVKGSSQTSTAAASSRPSSAAPTAATRTTVSAAEAGPTEELYVLPAQALLLYLCPDRDLYAGISKAVSVVAQKADNSGTTVDAAGLLQMCYPLVQPEQAAAVCRAPLKAQQVAAAVAAAAAAAAALAVSAPQVVSATGGKSSSGGSGGGGAVASRKTSSPGVGAAAAAAAAGSLSVQGELSEAVNPTVRPSQLMYGAACERIVTLLLHRYQWRDVYVSAML